ncbi:organic cation/carnitine transporter 3-like [Andrographis paniculata]|uniref:organic cation/carnitine transporter 3-like n=1 Tax=Andrographis paniculata TaxID=175694 RepID=UPI0021E8D3D7|nr:organic cation/carnitine transporter 3-like [Andrographis paniculata]
MSDPNTQSLPPTLEETIEYYIGDFGWKQLLQSTFISLAWFFDAHQTFITVFTDTHPKWSYRNTVSGAVAGHCNNVKCSADICKLSPEEWSWDLPASTSVVSEWSLLCAGPAVIRGLPASAFLVGSIVGGMVLAILGDSSLGRKKLLAMCCLIMSVSGVLASLSDNIWMYSGLRFLSGLGRGAIGGSAIVLASELVGKRWRDRVGIVGFFCFSLGFLSLPAIAFLLRGHSWRLMYLATCIPAAVYSLIVYFCVHESPRWLFIRGRKDEFLKTLKSLSCSNRGKKSLPELPPENLQGDKNDAVCLMLFKKSWAARRLMTAVVVSIGIGMPYYGMPLALGSQSFNLYLSSALSAVSEIPASLLSFYMIGKFRRRGSVMGLCVLSGTCVVGSVLAKGRELKGLQLGLQLASFFGSCAAFDMMVIYTLELFPTCVRSMAVSVARQAMVLGGAISPVLAAAAAERRNAWLSYGVFAAAILASGVCVVGLPETRGRALSDTMDEEECKNMEAEEMMIYGGSREPEGQKGGA